MATGTILLASRRHELAAMNVLVAFVTLLGSAREIGGGFRSHGSGRRCCRPMTSDTRRVLMGAFQLEFCRVVVKVAEFFPVPRVVTGFAGLLGGMRIRVTTRAGLIGEMILAGNWRRRSRDVRRIGVVYVG